MFDEHRGRQSEVVLMLEGARADFALPLRVGEVLISYGVLLNAILGGVHRAGAQGQRVPTSVGIAVGRWDVGGKDFGPDRLSDAEIDRFLKAADIDGDQYIRRAVRALGLDALGEALLGEQGVDLDPSGFAEFIERRRVEAWLAVGVDVHHALRRRGRDDAQEGSGGKEPDEGSMMEALAALHAVFPVQARSQDPRRHRTIGTAERHAWWSGSRKLFSHNSLDYL